MQNYPAERLFGEPLASGWWSPPNSFLAPFQLHEEPTFQQYLSHEFELQDVDQQPDVDTAIPTQNTTQPFTNQYDFNQDMTQLDSLQGFQSSCHDFINRDPSRKIQLFPPDRWHVEKGDLIMKVEIHKYNKQHAQELVSHSFMDGLVALRMCLEDICPPSRRPPTTPELFTLLVSTHNGLGFTSTDEHGHCVVSRPLSKDALWHVLSSYGGKFGEEYKLGIVSPTHAFDTYEINVLDKNSYSQTPKMVWIYNQSAHLGTDKWCAITPDGIEPEAKSFAQIVRQPGINIQPPHGGSAQSPASRIQVSGPPVPLNSTLLSNNTSEALRPLPLRHRRHSRAPSTVSGTRSSHRVTTESGRSYHTCPTCKQSWDSRSALTHHEKKHIPKDQRSVACTYSGCKARFHDKKSLNRHLPCHTKEQNFPCPFCPKRYTRDDNLKRHIHKAHQEEAELHISQQ